MKTFSDSCRCVHVGERPAALETVYLWGMWEIAMLRSDRRVKLQLKADQRQGAKSDCCTTDWFLSGSSCSSHVYMETQRDSPESKKKNLCREKGTR